METVDIVTEQNEVIGQISKEEAHRNGSLHRIIIAEVIDSQGNYVLVKQAGDRQDAGQFVSPVGGHIQAGESEAQALKRETFEEIGITEYRSKLIGKAIFNRHVIGRKENHYFIVYEIYTDQMPSLNHESVAYERFTKDQLKKELRDTPEKFGDAFHFVVRTFYPDLLVYKASL